MADCGRRARRLHLTLRQQMIAVVYFALVFTVIGAARDGAGTVDASRGALWSILLTPWMLGFLVMALDRPGPLRNWAVSMLFMLVPAALALAHDWIIAGVLLETGTIPSPAGTLAINVFFLGASGVCWQRMRPAECPTCGRAALIPLMMLAGPTRRTTRTRWCAACEALFWRTGDRPWQKERRRTWLDNTAVRVDEPDECPAGPRPDRVLAERSATAP